ncbi:MAG: hypothetical protein R2912_10670 [Eubacteriales bacterium]
MCQLPRAANLCIFPICGGRFNAACRIDCELTLTVGGSRRREIRLPEAATEAERALVSEYFCHASMYNLISTFGGVCMTLSIRADDAAAGALCESLDAVFQVQAPMHALKRLREVPER